MSSFVESLGGPLLWLWWAFLVLGVLGSVSFPVLYHVGSRGAWRLTEMGRHLMAYSAAVGVALGAYISRVALGDYPGRTAVMFGALVFLVFVVCWRPVIYLRVRKGKPREAGRHELV